MGWYVQLRSVWMCTSTSQSACVYMYTCAILKLFEGIVLQVHVQNTRLERGVSWVRIPPRAVFSLKKEKAVLGGLACLS